MPRFPLALPLVLLVVQACATPDRSVGPGPTAPEGPMAGPPAPQAQIAFASDRSGNWDVFKVNADGSGLTNLTADPAADGPNGVGGYEIAWSPTGAMLAFTSNRSGSVEIHTVSASGGRVTRVTSGGGEERNLAWSPDGQKIAFVRPGSGTPALHVWTIRTDGTGEIDLSAASGSPLGADSDPSWSPSGASLTFANQWSLLPNPTTYYSVLTMTSSGARRTGVASGRAPRWSPDGLRIAYQCGTAGDDDVCSILLDGTGEVPVIRAGPDLAPRWSPTGGQLAFYSTASGASGVLVVNTDGTGLRQVTIGGRAPEWSPDGGRIAFVRDDVYISRQIVRPISRIYTVSQAGGTETLVVPSTTSKNEKPVYRPI